VTRHGIFFSIVSILIALFGVFYRWQEFLLIGVLFAAVLVLSAVFVAYAPRSSLSSQAQIIATTRTDTAELRLDVLSRRKRGLFVEFADGPLPYRKFSVRTRRGKGVAQIPLDTSARCDIELARVHLIIADPFGFFERVIASCNPIEIVIQPRVFDIPGQITSRSRGGVDEGRTTGWGSQLSELVTEYNSGDELRRVHWRTSAKVGKLMVRKEMSPEHADVILCLDTDARSYSVIDSFANSRDEFDFEDFHELFVSLALAQAKSGKRVQVLTTGIDTTFELQHGMTAKFLRQMASTVLVQSGATSAAHVVKFARSFQPGQILFVTAKPNQQVLDLLSDLRRTSAVTVVGCNMTPDVRDLNVDTRSISLETM
jgi:uncharacterized protein (DUF58 family)